MTDKFKTPPRNEGECAVCGEHTIYRDKNDCCGSPNCKKKGEGMKDADFMDVIG